jgi:hypothetical protein
MDIQSAGSPSESFNIDKFKTLYQTFDDNTLKQLPNLYSESITFKDPIHELQGLAALRNYFAGFCSPDTHCSFQFINQIVTQDQAFFQWQMNYRHPKLQHGRQLSLNGGSLIRFNSHIIYHEDFYDMGAMIYQHIPILGWVVKKVNSRIAGEK